jgi:5'-nucleotidase
MGFDSSFERTKKVAKCYFAESSSGRGWPALDAVTFPRHDAAMQCRISDRRAGRLAALAAMLMLAGCAATSGRPVGRGPVPVVGIITISDFHGALEPPRLAVPAPDGAGGTIPVPAGGAAWLASAIDALRANHANHVTVSAGDLISASQLVSSIYLDEPTIGVMNRIGLEFNAVGNHEFDRGWRELLRLQAGGCEKLAVREPCQVEQFAGAGFRFLSASTYREDGSTLFPATGIKRFGSGAAQVSVGFAGLTLAGTNVLVSPAQIAGLRFGDEAEAINRAVTELKAQGADAVVVLIHQGGRTSGDPDPDGCNGLDGDILPILARLDPRVDVVVSGHTHWSYVCDYAVPDAGNAILLTSAGRSGQQVTDITLTIDPAQDRVIARRARNVIVQSPGYSSGRGDVPNTDAYPRFDPRADVAQYVQTYADAAREFVNRPAGWLAGPAAKAEGLESGDGGPLGNLIADAQLAATRAAGAQMAFMNPFGIRASLEPAADGALAFGQIYQTQPFGNELVTQTMSGAAVRALLEQCLDDQGPEQLLAPSAGLAYWFDRSRPPGQRITRIELDGQPLDPLADYRVTTNSFLAAGGDSFSVLTAQRDAVIGPNDLDALEAWLKQQPARAVPAERRVQGGG